MGNHKVISLSLIPINASIWISVVESKEVLTLASQATYEEGGEVTCTTPGLPSPITHHICEPISGKIKSLRPQAPDAAPRIFSIPVTKCFKSQGRVERKRAVRRGGRERNGRPESSARCVCSCIPPCDRAISSLHVP